MRKRKRDWRILVYRYGVYHPESSTPPEIVAQEALAMQAMWNDLLRRDEAKTLRYREIIAEDPDVARAQAVVADCKAAHDEAKQALLVARQRARKRAVPDQAILDEAIRRTKTLLHQAYAEEKRLRTLAKTEAREEIKELQGEYDRDIRQLRSTIKTVMGGSREFILDKFNAAKSAARKKGLALHEKRGFPLEINIAHLFTMGWPVRHLFQGQEETAQVDELKRRGGSSKVSFGDVRHGTAKRHRDVYPCTFLVRGEQITFDVFYNRPLPPNALIKSVILHGEQVRRAGFQRSRRDGQVYRVNARWEWSLLFTLEIPHPEEADESPKSSCGIDVGYRLMPDQSLRVAYLHGDNNQDQELRLPRSMVEKLRYVWDLQSKLDTEREEVTRILRTLPIPDDLSDEGRHLVSSPQLGFPGLRRLYAELLNTVDSEMKTHLTRWMVRSSRLYFEYRGLQRRLVRRRKDLYRKWAYWICQHYGTIQIEDLDVKQLGEQEKESLGHGEVGKYRAFAAVGMLLLILKQQGAKYLRTVVEKEPAMTTITCSICGEIVTSDRAELYVQCSNGHSIDQDQQAAVNLNDPAFPIAAAPA